MNAHATAPAAIGKTVFTREQAKASDKILNDLGMDVARKQQAVASARVSIHYAADDKRRGYSSNSPWTLGFDRSLEIVAARAADEEIVGYVRNDAQKALDRLAEARTELADANFAKREHAHEWREHGMWLRYTVVPGGHIHTDDECHTFRYNDQGQRTTDVRWAFPVSGDSVEQAIEVYGSALCTHCFPEAPVDRTTSTIAVDDKGNPMTKADAEAAKVARQAEKDAKTAAKNAKRVIDPATGTDVEDGDQRPLKTETAVRNEILRLLESIRYYGDAPARLYSRRDDAPNPQRSEVVAHLVACQALKNGRDAAELLAEYKAKDAKKRR